MNRIGVFVCACGTNVSEKVDISQVIAALSKVKDVVVAEQYRLLCSQEGRSYLEERIKQEKLTHVVVAACSPREHLQTFMAVTEKAGLNPYMMQLVNIREQCAWNTERPEEATEKAIRMIKGAVGRVRFHSPLKAREMSVDPDVLVLGGGIAGIEACLTLASQGRKVYLVEREPQLGGVMRFLSRTYPDMMDPLPGIQEKIDLLRASPRIEILTEHEVERVLGYLGHFEVSVHSRKDGGTARVLNVGSVVIATGAQLFDPNRMRAYDRRGMTDVLTPLEFESMCRSGKIELKDGKRPRSVAIVHCVGREVKGYCSGICCMYGLKFSRYLKEQLPEVDVTHLYWDLNIPGKGQQEFFEENLRSGIHMVRAAGVRLQASKEGTMVSYLEETGNERTFRPDMVILLTAMEPPAGTETLAKAVAADLDDEGFFARQNPRLTPTSTSMSGVYAVGTAQGPNDAAGCAVQARAAAGQILASLVPGRKIEIESKTSSIAESLCQGCGSCVKVCPFGAITMDERRKVAIVNEAICRGCGNCAAACPSGAAVVKHFTYDQIYQEIEEAIR
ncbi:MAG: FAD-dependent oxidoreductase [Methanomassiliicoccales archaeon]|nr:FAD-dependent oxidoreductase [Methanomassiliicoccales archaeon]